MVRFSKGIFAQTLVVACIAMQVMILLPHHHHEGSNVPCVNMFHCVGDCSDVLAHQCGCGHDHSSTPTATTGHDIASQGVPHDHDSQETDCVLNHLDAVSFSRERISGMAHLAVMMLNEVTVRTLIPCNCDYYDNLITQLDRKRSRVETPLPTDYIARAIPARAPSFTA